jgi:hypothetical protein
MPAISATSEAELEFSLEKMFRRPHLNQELGMMAWVCHLSYAGNLNRKIKVQAGLDKK